MTQLSVGIGSSVTFGVCTDSFVDMSSVSVQDTNGFVYHCTVPPIKQGRQRTMCSTAVFDGIDRNKLSAES